MSNDSIDIKFIQNHLPPLKDGNYTIEVKHTFKVDDNDTDTFSTSKDFYVSGERFTINPQEILNVYPPSNGQSDYSLQPPYIAIGRSTLPWERMVDEEDEVTPWLGLLVFSEDEMAQITTSTVTFKDINTASADPAFPGLEDEAGTSDTEQVQVIDVPTEILQPQLNNSEDLCLLGSARSSTNLERAYLMSNRLPIIGKQNIVYLVSFESRYQDGVFPVGSEKQIRLITLYSWSFTSKITYKVTGSILPQIPDMTDEILQKLNPIVGKVYNDTNSFVTELSTLLGDQLPTYQDELLAELKYGDYVNILKHTNRTPSTLRMPTNANTDLETLLAKGYTIIPHKMREGSQSVAFYHSPLIPAKSSDPSMSYPIMASDEVLAFFETYGMFDITYSSAWEIGRLVTLEQSDISMALYQWKKGHSHSSKNAQQVEENDTSHLPGALNAQSSIPPLPENVSNWLDDLKLLKNIPFSYLVPDENMLPTESLRFFYVDNKWLDALIDGALSMGRTTPDDHKNDIPIYNEINSVRDTVYSGVLIRSEVVATWTDMLIDGYNIQPDSENVNDPIDPNNKLSLLRMEQLSSNIMICIFEGDLVTLDIYGKPEAPHYGVEQDDTTGKIQKTLKDTTGVEDDDYIIDVPIDENNLILLNEFKSNISDFYDSEEKAFLWSDTPTSAEFSVQMLEGGQKIRFIVGG